MNDFFFYNHEIIAKTSINVLNDTINTSNDKFKAAFDVKKNLLEKHKGISVVSNSIEYFLMNISKNNLMDDTNKRKQEIEKKLTEKIRQVAVLGAKKITNNSEVFIHSINNQILEILLEASKYKKFKVNVLEHHPHKHGEKILKKLERNKIKYTLYHDLDMEKAIEFSDICFIGGEAILNNKGAIVKTGTGIVSNIAKKTHCPIYVCAHSWRFDYKNNAHFLLNHRIRDKNQIESFEFLSHTNIDSYITEHGIFKPEQTIEEIKYFNKWMRL